MKFSQYFFTLLLFILSICRAQAQEFCGAHAPDSVIARMDELQPSVNFFTDQWVLQRGQSAGNSAVQIPLKIHIIRQSNGTGGLDPNEVDDILDDLNAFYAGGGFEFFLCGDVAFVDNSTFYDFHESEEDELFAASYIENVINVYFVNELTGLGGNALCGYAYFPFQNVEEDYVMVSYSCGAKTLAHELGHYFGAYHTHGTVNFGCSTDEWVNGGNCDAAGDRVCDTPADPGLLTDCNTANNSCQYIGTATDANGQFYNPDVYNLMSYAPKHCRNHFSAGQFARMAYYQQNYRANLTCSNSSGACSGQTNLTDCTGTISDGSDNNAYGNLLNCSWLIQPANAGSVTLTFSDFDTEIGYDFVTIYNGPDANAPMLGAYSGNTIPPAITANSGRMFITFTSDEYIGGAGWAASYTCSTGGGGGACSGQTNLTDCTGTISDGSGNNNYGDMLACSWLIQPANAGSVTLTFSAFDTEIGYDFVTIYDGPDANAPLLGAYSGNTIPPAITANSGEMFITFISDETINGAGWTASYTCSTGGGGGACSGQTNFSDCTGTISDGSGNNNYGDMLACSWLIQPANANAVTLTFSAFDTENGYDFVTIYDGPDANAPLLGAYSGNTIPPAITANSGEMFIAFTSDETINGAGWTASYACSGGGSGCSFTPVVTATNNCYLKAPNGSNFQWYKNEVAIPGATGQSYTALENALYKVEMTDPNGCMGTSQPYLAFCLTDAAEREKETRLYLAPNPAHDQAVVYWDNWSDETFQLEVSAPDGRLIARRPVEKSETGQFTLPVADWPNGVYIVRFGARTQRLVVQH